MGDPEKVVEPEDRIEPNGIYTGEQAEELLKGFVGLETLRKKGGLKGLPKGYFGGSLLSALHRYCGTIWSERGSGLPQGETYALFENRGKECPPYRRVRGNRKASKCV